jgi:hypothetical protein
MLGVNGFLQYVCLVESTIKNELSEKNLLYLSFDFIKDFLFKQDIH